MDGVLKANALEPLKVDLGGGEHIYIYIFTTVPDGTDITRTPSFLWRFFDLAGADLFKYLDRLGSLCLEDGLRRIKKSRRR